MWALRYKHSQVDHTLFIKHSSARRVKALLVYLDDITVTENDNKEQELLSHCLAKEFDIKTPRRLKYFLGTEIVHSKHDIFILQQKYIIDLLIKTCNTTYKPTSTLINLNLNISLDEEAAIIDRKMYRCLIGKLIYLSHTRPNIDYAVRVII